MHYLTLPGYVVQWSIRESKEQVFTVTNYIAPVGHIEKISDKWADLKITTSEGDQINIV